MEIERMVGPRQSVRPCHRPPHLDLRQRAVGPRLLRHTHRTCKESHRWRRMISPIRILNLFCLWFYCESRQTLLYLRRCPSGQHNIKMKVFSLHPYWKSGKFHWTGISNPLTSLVLVYRATGTLSITGVRCCLFVQGLPEPPVNKRNASHFLL